MNYEQRTMNCFIKNKAKTKPNKAKLLRNSAFVNSVKAEDYKNNLRFWPKIHEPKFILSLSNGTNPNLLRIWSNISYGKSKGYETNPRFCPKNPKAKTNPIYPELVEWNKPNLS